MIQRIQTLFLVLLILAAGLTFVFPFVTFQIGESETVFNVMGMLVEDHGVPREVMKIPVWPFMLLIAVLALATIFTFKNRALQMKLGGINFILILFVTSMLYYFALTLHTEVPIPHSHAIESPEVHAEHAADMTASISWGLGIFMPLFMLVFAFLANKGIRKDEALVKSFDRLR